jgi:hypothetical protein
MTTKQSAATTIPVTELKAGDRIAGATVIAVAISKSGKTVKITIPSSSAPGELLTFSQSANTRIAIFPKGL